MQSHSGIHGIALGTQTLTGLDDASSHTGLGLPTPRARVVHLLVADLTVDLQHAAVVGHDVIDDRAGEGVLGVGVDVHLDDAVRHRVGDLLGRGAGAAVEDEVEWLVLTVLLAALVLDLLEDLRTQLDVSGLVGAVDVAEGEGRDVATLLAQTCLLYTSPSPRDS